MHSAAPEWVETVDAVRALEQDIRTRMAALRELHASHLKPSPLATDKAQEEKEIKRQTEEIKLLFRKGDITIRRLIAKQGDQRHRAADAQKLLNNVQISLVTSLSECSREFQEQHRKYALEVQKQRRRTARLANMGFRQDDEMERREEQLQMYVEKGFTQEQIDTILINEQLVLERDTELQNIYHNITDLHSMFKDLNRLVIDQGTLLDRIDHNVEEAFQQMKDSNKKLKEAVEYAGKSKFVLIVLFLVSLLMLGILGLVLKIMI